MSGLVEVVGWVSLCIGGLTGLFCGAASLLISAETKRQSGGEIYLLPIAAGVILGLICGVAIPVVAEVVS